jgi:hypothetical protein
MYGLFRCDELPDPLTPADDPRDACGSEWIAELPDLVDGFEGWPMCECGRMAHLITPFMPVS